MVLWGEARGVDQEAGEVVVVGLRNGHQQEPSERSKVQTFCYRYCFTLKSTGVGCVTSMLILRRKGRLTFGGFIRRCGGCGCVVYRT